MYKGPLNSLVIRMSTCILPNSHAQSTHEANRNQMKNLLCHIISLDILTPPFSDKVINQFSKFLTTECTFNQDIFIGYDQSIVGKHLVRDHMLTNKLKPHNVQVISNLKAALSLHVKNTKSHSRQRGLRRRNRQ